MGIILSVAGIIFLSSIAYLLHIESQYLVIDGPYANNKKDLVFSVLVSIILYVILLIICLISWRRVYIENMKISKLDCAD